VWHFGCPAFLRDMHSHLQELSFLHLLRARCIPRFIARHSLDGHRPGVNESVHRPTDDWAHISLRVSLLLPLSSCGLDPHELDTSMHRPRDCVVLFTAPHCPGAVLWLSLVPIIFLNFLYRC
jgi:hypothetical protein